MAQPKELTIAEIRQYMLDNGCKVTNHSLVKHFKRFLTHPQTQNEARKQFKTYVNILSTIKNEDNQKYLILRKKYINESPSDEVVERAVASATNESAPSSPGGGSIISDGGLNSPFRQPPPYKPPPDVTPTTTPKAAAPTATTGINVHKEHVDNYRDCVNEFNENYSARQKNSGRLEKSESSESANIDANKNAADNKSISRSSSVDETNNKENIPRFSFSSGMSLTSTDSSGPDKASGAENEASENPMSVKEATRKFNRLASEEESRIISPPAKKKPEKELIEEKALPEVILPPLKIKEWIVSMSKANYQELVKLANEHPELVKIQDPATGYTALHWAAKHGNEDVVKLIAGTYKADVNARTNGGYTPLHLAIQFGRDHIFELLWNVYKANRDLMDWSGNKPLDYSQQRPSVSASTCSSEYRNYFYNTELNSNFHLGDQWSRNTSPRGGGSIGSALTRNKKRSHLRYATVAGGTGGGAMSRTQSLLRTGPSRRQKKATVQSMFLRDEDEEKDLLPRSILLLPNVPTNNNNNNTIKSAQSELSKSANTTDDDETSDQLPNSTSTKDNTGTFNTSTRRKESFLRKTFRAAANRHNSNNVTNQMTTK